MSAYHNVSNMLAKTAKAPSVQESEGARREREEHELEQQWSQPATYDIGLELDLARNMLGKLGPDIRRRIDAVVSNPSQKTWEDAHSIIVGSDGSMTLWQAVLAVDPSFLRTGPYGSDEWDEIPDQKTLLKAIQYATH